MSDRVVMVTGASSGIGAATARMLGARGTTVAIVARREGRLDEVLADCLPSSPRSKRWAADLGDVDAAVALALEIWDAYGRIDVVINNAAIPMRRSLERLTMEEIRRTMEVNYFSPIAISHALFPRMVERGSGIIINVSSLGGRLGIMAEAAYSASKFAMAGWSESAAIDLAGTGVSVKLVLPGAIDTEIWDLPDNDAPIYDGPLAPPEEVAAGILAAIEDDGFEYYLPDMKPIVEAKTSDLDSFLVGMKAMATSKKEAGS